VYDKGQILLLTITLFSNLFLRRRLRDKCSCLFVRETLSNYPIFEIFSGTIFSVILLGPLYTETLWRSKSRLLIVS